MEEKHEHEESKLVICIQNTIDVPPSQIFVNDSACRHIACNRAFDDCLGLPREKLPGATVYDVVPASLAARYEAKGGGRNCVKGQV